jgi:hypothetical protein
MELTETQKRKLAQKVPKLWNVLAPLQRSKVFHMKPTCLFVFHTWEELDKKQKDIVYNAVRICIEQAIVREEIGKFVDELKRIGGKHLPHVFN